MSFLSRLFYRQAQSGIAFSRLRYCTQTSSDSVNEKSEFESALIKKSPILDRTLEFPTRYRKPRQIWIENFDTIKEEKRGLVELHPNVFATLPRMDLIYQNFTWQIKYRHVSFENCKTKSELPGSNRKHRPQKGLGRARMKSFRSPHFIQGAKCHGPRNPTSFYYMIPLALRVMGLTAMLSVKFAQDDIHVVDNLDIPTKDSQYILDLVAERHWGDSVLILDEEDLMPSNITTATDKIPYINLMPTYGLNVYSMLKYDTLVLTLAAVNSIEKSLLFHLNHNDPHSFNSQLHM